MNRSPVRPDGAAEAPYQWLSDLADGRLDPAALDRGCTQWSEDAETRRTWHAYQVIGDVMRSEELARGTSRDADFLSTLRVRLAAEPVVLAPGAVTQASLGTPVVPAVAARPARTSSAASILAAGRQRWLRPMAAAAGFVAVAGVVVVVRQAAPGAPSPSGATWASQGATVVAVGADGRAIPVSAQTGVAVGTAQGQMLRDAQIDAYLRAHRDALAGSPSALPGGGVRTVDFEASQR
jgi:sigma-E factor negative regulatory protein RseA